MKLVLLSLFLFLSSVLSCIPVDSPCNTSTVLLVGVFDCLSLSNGDFLFKDDLIVEKMWVQNGQVTFDADSVLNGTALVLSGATATVLTGANLTLESVEVCNSGFFCNGVLFVDRFTAKGIIVVVTGELHALSYDEPSVLGGGVSLRVTGGVFTAAELRISDYSKIEADSSDLVFYQTFKGNGSVIASDTTMTCKENVELRKGDSSFLRSTLVNSGTLVLDEGKVLFDTANIINDGEFIQEGITTSYISSTMTSGVFEHHNGIIELDGSILANTEFHVSYSQVKLSGVISMIYSTFNATNLQTWTCIDSNITALTSTLIFDETVKNLNQCHIISSSSTLTSSSIFEMSNSKISFVDTILISSQPNTRFTMQNLDLTLSTESYIYGNVSIIDSTVEFLLEDSTLNGKLTVSECADFLNTKLKIVLFENFAESLTFVPTYYELIDYTCGENLDFVFDVDDRYPIVYSYTETFGSIGVYLSLHSVDSFQGTDSSTGEFCSKLIPCIDLSNYCLCPICADISPCTHTIVYIEDDTLSISNDTVIFDENGEVFGRLNITNSNISITVYTKIENLNISSSAVTISFGGIVHVENSLTLKNTTLTIYLTQEEKEEIIKSGDYTLITATEINGDFDTVTIFVDGKKDNSVVLEKEDNSYHLKAKDNSTFWVILIVVIIAVLLLAIIIYLPVRHSSITHKIFYTEDERADTLKRSTLSTP